MEREKSVETPTKSANICAVEKKFSFGMEEKNLPRDICTPLRRWESVYLYMYRHTIWNEENKKEEITRRRLSRQKWESHLIMSWRAYHTALARDTLSEHRHRIFWDAVGGFYTRTRIYLGGEEQTDINCVENKGTVLSKTAFAERTTLTLCRTLHVPPLYCGHWEATKLWVSHEIRNWLRRNEHLSCEKKAICILKRKDNKKNDTQFKTQNTTIAPQGRYTFSTKKKARSTLLRTRFCWAAERT